MGRLFFELFRRILTEKGGVLTFLHYGSRGGTFSGREKIPPKGTLLNFPLTTGFLAEKERARGEGGTIGKHVVLLTFSDSIIEETIVAASSMLPLKLFLT